MEYVYLALAGLAGGFLAGLLGIGGGILYILILPVALSGAGVPDYEIVQYTIANSLFGTFAASLSGTISLFRKGEFYPKEVFIVGVFSVAAALLSLNYIVNTPFYSQRAFNIVVILVLGFVLVKTITRAKRAPAYDENMPHKNLILGGSGLFGGLISSLSGLGGGAIIVPLLNIGMRMDIKMAKSISLGMIVLSSISMTIFNSFEQPVYDIRMYNTGYLVWPIALTLSAGVVVASPIGVAVGRRAPSHIISYVFSIFILIVIGLKSYNLFEASV
jgi:uncharacterized membrane protein YfcA